MQNKTDWFLKMKDENVYIKSDIKLMYALIFRYIFHFCAVYQGCFYTRLQFFFLVILISAYMKKYLCIQALIIKGIWFSYRFLLNFLFKILFCRLFQLEISRWKLNFLAALIDIIRTSISNSQVSFKAFNLIRLSSRIKPFKQAINAFDPVFNELRFI